MASVLPCYGTASLADLLPSVLAALRPDSAAAVPLGLAADPLGLAAGPLSGVRAALVLLVDGLGQHQLPLAAPHAPTLADLAAGRLPGSSARAITAGFPSTTPTSLVSLGTGAAAGRHGVVGFTVKLPGSDRVLNHIQWWDDPDPLTWQPLPTQFDRARAAGVAAVAVGPPEFAGTGLTIAAYRGSTYVGAADEKGLAAAMLAAMGRADHHGAGRALVYGYHPYLDQAGHVSGVGSPQWIESVEQVDRLLARLVDGLAQDTALLVTADHGQLNVPQQHRFDIDADERLRAGVSVVAGEPRVRYLHCRPGAAADVRDTWRGVLGDAAWVVQRDDAVAQGWFGPVPPQHLARIGDVVVACHGDYAVLHPAAEPPTVARLVAFHGSATETEMRIPLLIARR